MGSKVVRQPIGVWWNVSDWVVKIEPVQAVAVTDKTITFLENKAWSGPPRWEEQRREISNFFPSFAEAKAEAIRRATARVNVAKRNMEDGLSKLRQWESLKEPAPPSAPGPAPQTKGE